jgi:type II secretory ATPase GspE/PulE/Tfp pilus assembly ATPase PilB-like protein
VKVAIKKGAAVEDLKDIAIREKMTTLKMDGIQKVFQGLTDMSQVLQVCL